jgi:hypothetical protein
MSAFYRFRGTLPGGGRMIVLLLSALAWADAIGMPPDDCPNGSMASSSHCGEFCLPTVCDPSAPQCGEGESCEAQVGLCVEKTMGHQSCGNVPLDYPDPMVERHDAKGTCSSNADCESGQECLIAARCVKPSAVSSICPFAASVPLGLGLLGLAAAPFARRKENP